MDRRVIALTLTLLLALASVAGARMNPAWLGGGGTASLCSGSEIVCQDFEAAGTPYGWSVSGDASINFDATTTAIDGNQYLSATYTTVYSYIRVPLGASYSTLYIAGKIRFRARNSTTSSVIALLDGTNQRNTLQFESTGDVRVVPYGGSGGSYYSGGFALNSVVMFKIYSNAGTMTLYTSTDGSTWVQRLTSSSGTFSGTWENIDVIVSNSAALDIDSLKISSTDINL